MSYCFIIRLCFSYNPAALSIMALSEGCDFSFIQYTLYTCSHVQHLPISVQFCVIYVQRTEQESIIFPLEIQCNSKKKFLLKVAAVDLLAPGVGEICGGSLREERFDALHTTLHKLNMSDSYRWSVNYAILCNIISFIESPLR